MSRGLGKVQRAVLEVLRAEPDAVLPTPVLAMMVGANEEQRTQFREQPLDIRAMVAGMHPPRESTRTAVSRACHALWRAGRVEKYRVVDTWSGWRIAER